MPLRTTRCGLIETETQIHRRENVRELQAQETRQLAAFVILTMAPPPGITGERSITANVQAPIVINQHTHRGTQLILMHSPYHTRHPLPTPAAESCRTRERLRCLQCPDLYWRERWRREDHRALEDALVDPRAAIFELRCSA